MPLIPSSLEQNLESVSKIATASSKFGVLVGGVCVIAYSVRISYFPQDLSVGDGLLFIMAAACFGVIYAFFVGSLVSLGICVSPVTRGVFHLIVWGVNLFKKRKIQPEHKLAPFEWSSPLFAIFAVIIILVFGSKDSRVYWSLPSLSVGLYLFYSAYLSCGKKIKEIETIKNSRVHTEAKENVAQLGDVEKFQTGQVFSLLTILVVPLLLGGVSGQLLDAAMRAAHVRIEKAVIFVKEPHSTLLPKSLVSKDRSSPKDFTAFDGAVVLFKGFGKTTVISFPDGTTTKQLEIPNDQIIVEDR